jgi:pimeloyl-ACP methyl ester carboxylesterase
MDVFLELSAYKGPVLILQGLEDETVNYSYAIRATKSYENGQCHLQLIRNVGHGLNEKQKESAVASIR